MALSAKLAGSITPTALLLTGSVDGCGAVRAALEEVGLVVIRSELASAALVEALESEPLAIFFDARHDLGLTAELCRSLRAVEGLSAIHVVAITDSADADARLRLYEAGADECWTFSEEPQQFLRRSAELVRPLLIPQAPRVLRCGGVSLNPERYTVTCWGRTVHLTAMQLKLLEHLMKNPGVVFSYRQLLEEVWRNPDGDERMVRAGIVRLRRALGTGAGQSDLIKTVRGGGYAFNPLGDLKPDLDSAQARVTKS